jgi:hypothetical protein
MITEEEYELAVDAKCYQIRLVQKELAHADVPDALSYNYGGDESAKDLLLSELNDLVTKWGEGATKLQTIQSELDTLNEERDLYAENLAVERLDVAINTVIETKEKIEEVANRVAELEVDHLDEWTDDAQEFIERLAFPVSPIRLYDWRGMPRWYGLDALYPFDEVWDQPPGTAKPVWAALFGNPLTGIPAKIFGLTRKYIQPHQEVLKHSFAWVVIGLAIILLPYHPGYSFGAVVVAITADCYWSRYWGDFVQTVMFWGALYGCLLMWFG